MKNSLEVRRELLLRELNRVNRRIDLTQKSLTRIRCRIAVLQPPTTKAA